MIERQKFLYKNMMNAYKMKLKEFFKQLNQFF